MRKFKCWLKAIPHWLLTGNFYVSHENERTYEEAIIISSPRGWRIANNYEHSADETVHPHGCLVKLKCVHCGREDAYWYCSFKEKDRYEGSDRK